MEKNNKIKKILICILVALLILVVFLCAPKLHKHEKSLTEIDKDITELVVQYNEKTVVDEYTGKIDLSDNKIEIQGIGIINTGNIITINKGGSYYITGQNEDCNIIVDAEKQEVQLFLENCNISSKTTAPINGINASELIITLVENSENTISDAGEYVNFTDNESLEPDGAVFTKTDLVINGTGKLIVNGNYKDGIVSKDTLKISDCNIDITSTDDGIRGKDFVALNNSNITVESKGDGIKATNSESAELGYVLIEGGNININSEADGIQAETVLNISKQSNINITTTGEITSPGNQMDHGHFGYYNSNTTTEEDSVSSKALKAGKEITIINANIEIKSTDDSVHSNEKIIIEDSKLNLNSGDDGIHADTNIIINSGNINISKSYEGIESGYIEINGGTISVVASDDGINVAGGNDGSAMVERPGQNQFSNISDSDKKLIITDGNLYINATGDGLDSNGSIEISGGIIEVAGPTSGGNGALDYTSYCTVTAGDIVVYGSTGMWQNFSNTSTQYSLTYQVSGNSGDIIVLKDSLGNEIKTFTMQKTYGAIMISNENLKKGEKYTLYQNGNSVGEIEVTNIVNSTLSGMNDFGNMQPGMKNDGNMQPGMHNDKEMKNNRR